MAASLRACPRSTLSAQPRCWFPLVATRGVSCTDVSLPWRLLAEARTANVPSCVCRRLLPCAQHAVHPRGARRCRGGLARRRRCCLRPRCGRGPCRTHTLIVFIALTSTWSMSGAPDTRARRRSAVAARPAARAHLGAIEETSVDWAVRAPPVIGNRALSMGASARLGCEGGAGARRRGRACAQAVERQLNNIPDDFKSQKFNSLKRVLEILGKDRPQWALQEARALAQLASLGRSPPTTPRRPYHPCPAPGTAGPAECNAGVTRARRRATACPARALCSYSRSSTAARP